MKVIATAPTYFPCFLPSIEWKSDERRDGGSFGPQAWAWKDFEASQMDILSSGTKMVEVGPNCGLVEARIHIGIAPVSSAANHEWYFFNRFDSWPLRKPSIFGNVATEARLQIMIGNQTNCQGFSSRLRVRTSTRFEKANASERRTANAGVQANLSKKKPTPADLLEKIRMTSAFTDYTRVNPEFRVYTWAKLT